MSNRWIVKFLGLWLGFLCTNNIVGFRCWKTKCMIIFILCNWIKKNKKKKELLHFFFGHKTHVTLNLKIMYTYLDASNFKTKLKSQQIHLIHSWTTLIFTSISIWLAKSVSFSFVEKPWSRVCTRFSSHSFPSRYFEFLYCKKLTHAYLNYNLESLALVWQPP